MVETVITIAARLAAIMGVITNQQRIRYDAIPASIIPNASTIMLNAMKNGLQFRFKIDCPITRDDREGKLCRCELESSILGVRSLPICEEWHLGSAIGSQYPPGAIELSISEGVLVLLDNREISGW
jgi:hypothetical protein